MTGLIWAWFHPKTEIIAGDDLEVRQKFWDIPLPQYIYTTRNSKIFTENVMGRAVENKTIHVGIYSEGAFRESNPRLRRMYYEKTRREKKRDIPDHVMGSDKPSFEVLDLPFHVLEQELLEIMKERCIFKRIEEIDIQNREMKLKDSEEKIKWNDITVTFPQPIFWGLCKGKETRALFFNSVSIYTVKAKVQGPNLIWDSPYDYILFPDPDHPFYRITKGLHPHVGIECSSPPSFADFLSFFPEDSFCEQMGQKKHGKIVGRNSSSQEWEVNFPPMSERIRFFGRYGAWNPSLKVHNLIDEALEDARKEKGIVPESMEEVHK